MADGILVAGFFIWFAGSIVILVASLKEKGKSWKDAGKKAWKQFFPD